MVDDVQASLLRDILDSARAIREYLAGVSYESFAGNTEKQDAVVRRFEIIGEASGKLSPQARALFPNLPFQRMRGMRNILIHDYGEVDIGQVWQTATHDLEPLIDEISGFLDRVP
ncbi:MAG: DUF86 domain-containing protein [Phycisphaera sp.]|nr:DUF86 domain-containing protein [Phycisphaera sp.]